MNEADRGGDFVAEARALLAGGRAQEAAGHLDRALKSGRGGLYARLLLIRAWIESGRQPDALALARELSSLHPELALAASSLGDALRASRYLPAAIAEYQRALRLDHALAEARFGLGAAWLAAGEPDRALAELAELAGDEIEGLSGMIAEAEAMKQRPRADAGYVRHLFDQFAGDYDARMRGQLAYQAPEVLRRLFGLVRPAATSLDILDLGCGTGLAGAAFEDIAARLDGIDLSPAMIARAQARGIYDDLSVADIESVFGERARYDLVLAADTLVYLGELEGVFRGAAERLRNGGCFLFTVETKDGEGYALGPKRRWRHSEPYLRARASAFGFDVAGLIACTPRTEAGAPVPGLAVALCKPAS